VNDAAPRLLREAARPVAADARHDALRAALAAVAREGDGAADRVWELGVVHGVLPLLARRVATLPSGDRGEMPDGLADRLARRRRDVSFRNLHQLTLLAEVGEHLEVEGVPVLAFKGPALACTVYPELGLREFVDLDILVAERNRERALRALRSRGFQSSKGTDVGAPVDTYAVPLFRARDGCQLDLHWRLAPEHRALAPDHAGIRRRAEGLEIRGRDIRVPRPEDHLLLLAVHGAKHGPRPWPKLKWIADVAWLLDRHPDANWEAGLERARDAGGRRALLLAVALARDLLDARVPARLESALRSEPVAGKLARDVSERLFRPFDAPESLLWRVGFDWRVLERPRDRLGYLGRRLFLPTGRDRDDPVGRRLPRPLLFAYRWLRLLGTYIRHPGRLTRHWR
jgi:hypothetical protein